MKFNRVLLFLLVSLSPFLSFSQENKLYQTILDLDSTFFHAYNTCDIERQASFFSDSIEFFHDRSGLETSKKNILESTKKYICGKVTRELVKGSVEVSPLPGYGAVEVGMHRFYNNQEKDAESRESRFIILWRYYRDEWKIAKVISLH